MVNQKYKNKYGLLSGLAVVIGTTLGCGVFIKAADVLRVSKGSLQLSLLAWLLGGIIMVVSAFCFAIYASRVVKFGGCIDYIEDSSNKTVGYYIGYYLSTIYFPLFTAQISIVGSQYLISCFTDNTPGDYVIMLVAFSFITIFLLLNFLAPKIANYFQISILFVKILPLVLIIFAGLFASLIRGAPGIIKAFTEPATDAADQVASFGEAIKITSFAYDGWICVTSLNAEMKDSKKNLPRAIVIGTSALVVLYLIFFIGFSAILGNKGIIENGEMAAGAAFIKIFGVVGGTIFLLFLAISCIGTINVNIFTTSRSLIALGYRNVGFVPKKMFKTDSKGNFTYVPYVFTYLFVLLFLLIWYLANRGDIPYFNCLDNMDTVASALLYLVYIFVYINIMRNFKNENVFIRFIMPSIAMMGSIFFALCGTGMYQLMVDGDIRPFFSFLTYISLCIIIMIPSVVLKIKNHYFANA